VADSVPVQPRISVIIPTHRRVEALAALLESLAAQTAPREEFEVLIVDDGSPEAEHAHLQAMLRERFAALPIVCWRQERAGPARARNQALQRAAAPLVLILNDDVTLAPDHLAAHLAAHAAVPEERVVFRGITEWAPDTPDTPLMRWMRATSFRYDWVLFHPVEAHFVHFTTCDLSAKRSLLVAFPFDETFDTPCGEDSELALRLLKAGRLEVRLLPAARSWHHHPHDFAAFRRRARMQGRAMARLLERHPELEYRLRGGHLRLCSQPRRLARAAKALVARRPLEFYSNLHDWLMLREIDRHRPRPAGDGGPYPERLLSALPPGWDPEKTGQSG
jgi:GT2 family glycosyltransferase